MQADPPVPAAEFADRLRRTQAEMQASDIGALFLTHPVDICYLTGLEDRGYLYLPAGNDPLILISAEAEFPEGFRHPGQAARFRRPEDIPGLITEACGEPARVLGLQPDVLPVNRCRRLQSLFGSRRYVDGSAPVLRARRVKSDWEVKRMEETAQITAQAFAFMRSIIRPGLTEIEFAGMFEAYAARLSGSLPRLRVRDHLTEGYPWHVLSGRSGGMVGLLDSPASGEGISPAFPCGAGPKQLAAREPVMVDFAWEHRGYHVDETRMFAIEQMPPEALAASRAAIEIHQAVLGRVRPGVTVGELYRHSVSVAESLGFADVFLGPPGHKVAFVGHAIGLELIESPIIARNRQDVLEPGMTFSLEPKLVYDGRFAAGVESVFVVTDSGHRLISRVPVEIFLC